MKKFKDFINETKDKAHKKLLQERSDNPIDLKEPFKKTFDQKEVKKMNVIAEINKILKFRDPILEKMTYEIWLTIPQNKEIAELNEYHAQRLYEQDMDRADKVQAAGRASGGGVRKKKVVAAEAVKYYWTPDLMPSCSLWLDADDASSMTISGSNISQWNDKSGNGNHYGQATAAAQPAYSASVQNGRSVVWCDPASQAQFLTRSATTDYVDGNDHWTTFTVHQRYKNHGNSNPHYGNIFSFGYDDNSFGGSDWVVLHERGDHSPADFVLNADGTTYDANVLNGAAGSWQGLTQIMTWRAYSSGTEIRVTGTLGNGTNPAGVKTGLNGTGFSAVNATHVGSGIWASHYFAEIIQYKRGLTDAECATVETYLQNKWDITVATQSVDPVLGSDNSYTP